MATVVNTSASSSARVRSRAVSGASAAGPTSLCPTYRTNQSRQVVSIHTPGRLAFRSAVGPSAPQRLGTAKRGVSLSRPRSGLTTTNAAVVVRDTLETLINKTDLTQDETEAVLSELLKDGDAAQVSAFLVLLRAKGETADEVAGLASAMIKEAVPVDCGDDVLDIVGTGGDGIGSVNISTGACLVAAAAGARVA
eukprot:CAMPEP_0197859412 /NCGR_PEP_ID=MMETSP1438-20131217/33940_1 /TAXON_ID=1461541 /ORGANISM="Pterosperma sp., Strain CCMP1384" /LENGTH=194 /DNA_ID=CAMNT_0043475889 /DNA_START=103 /DNA_END=683 /DNA_ORIENTATION=+